MPRFYYGVFNGKEGNKVYSSWDEAWKNIQSRRGCKHKKFASHDEAEEFANTGTVEFKHDKSILRVWTDGSANPTKKCGGCGIVFGLNDPRNASIQIDEENVTSPRCELFSVYLSLKMINEDPEIMKDYPVEIMNDCKYAVDSIQNIPIWMKNGWIKYDKTPVKNKDVLIKLWSEFRKRKNASICKITAHAGNPGNCEADKLAKLAWQETDVNKTVIEEEAGNIES